MTAELTVSYSPPLGLFGSLLLEKDGEHAYRIDIKKHCLIPLINIVRLFSFERHLSETATIGRLAALKTAESLLDRAGRKRQIHPNTAARTKKRLAKAAKAK